MLTTIYMYMEVVFAMNFHSRIVKWVLGTGPERAGYSLDICTSKQVVRSPLFPKGKKRTLEVCCKRGFRKILQLKAVWEP